MRANVTDAQRALSLHWFNVACLLKKTYVGFHHRPAGPGRMHEAILNFGGLTEKIVPGKRSFTENIGLNLVVCIEHEDSLEVV